MCSRWFSVPARVKSLNPCPTTFSRCHRLRPIRDSYGSDPNQFLDLRLPKEKAPLSSINIHGGFWRAKYNLDHAGHLCAALTAKAIRHSEPRISTRRKRRRSAGPAPLQTSGPPIIPGPKCPEAPSRYGADRGHGTLSRRPTCALPGRSRTPCEPRGLACRSGRSATGLPTPPQQRCGCRISPWHARRSTGPLSRSRSHATLHSSGTSMADSRLSGRCRSPSVQPKLCRRETEARGQRARSSSPRRN